MNIATATQNTYYFLNTRFVFLFVVAMGLIASIRQLWLSHQLKQAVRRASQDREANATYIPYEAMRRLEEKRTERKFIGFGYGSIFGPSSG
jgi:hypothetical protein